MKKHLWKATGCILNAAMMTCAAAIPTFAEEEWTVEPAGGWSDTCKMKSIFYIFEYAPWQEFMEAWHESFRTENGLYRRSDESYTEVAEAYISSAKHYSLEDSLWFTVSICSAYYAQGYITEEELYSYVDAAAAGEPLPVEAHDKINAPLANGSFKYCITGEDGWGWQVDEDALQDKAGTWAERYQYGLDTAWQLRNDARYTALIEAENGKYYSYGFTYYLNENNEPEAASEVEGLDKAASTALLRALLSGSGDLDGSGDAGLVDAVLLARAVSGTQALTLDARREADLNGDTAIDQTDFTLLLRKLAGL